MTALLLTLFIYKAKAYLLWCLTPNDPHALLAGDQPLLRPQPVGLRPSRVFVYDQRLLGLPALPTF